MCKYVRSCGCTWPIRRNCVIWDHFELEFSVSRPEKVTLALFWLIFHLRIRGGKTSARSHTLHLVLLLPGYSQWPFLEHGPAQITCSCFCCWWVVPQSQYCLWNIVLIVPSAICFLTIKFRLKFSKAAGMLGVRLETILDWCTHSLEPPRGFWKPLEWHLPVCYRS